eukprot:GEZU01024020.1.p1 GENE.GEZU01024020.1~~GEZU01024020.1.p1  ORF type:complete len:180 (-),score=33.76 GEZU01024020.1:45-584(-)
MNESTSVSSLLIVYTIMEYIKKYDLQLYFNDVLAQLLESRTDKPLEFIADYFNKVVAGTHVIKREYAFVNASLHNRKAFADAFYETYKTLENDKGRVFTCSEYTQLVRLLCNDFPVKLIHQIYSACEGAGGAGGAGGSALGLRINNNNNNKGIPLSEFVNAFRLHFCQPPTSSSSSSNE